MEEARGKIKRKDGCMLPPDEMYGRVVDWKKRMRH